MRATSETEDVSAYNSSLRQDDIANLIACPVCRTRLGIDGISADCESCGRHFRQRGNAWDLSPPRVVLRGLETKKAPRRGWKHRLWPPTPSLNLNRVRLLQLVAQASAQGPVLDLGSGERRLGERVINFELDLFPNVDVIGSAHALPFVDGGFDLVICQAVLEHVRDPHGVVAEIGRVLSGGGCVYAEVPFLQGYHADPHDYQRYTLTGIEALFDGFEVIDSGVCVGPASALGWLATELAGLVVPTRLGQKGARFAVGWLAAAFKHCDRVLARRPDAHRIAGGLFFYGRTRREAA